MPQPAHPAKSQVTAPATSSEAVHGSFFTRHGGKIVIVARSIEGLHQANGIIAGITTMPWLRFLAFNALGPALRVSTWPSAGEEPPPGSDWGRTCQG